MTHAIVLDGEQRSALAATRSLGHRGIHVTVGASCDQCLAGASRFARHTQRLPVPEADPAGYRDAVTSLFESSGADIVVPCTEPSILALRSVSGTDSLPMPMPLPPESSLGHALDKSWLARRAPSFGIHVPETQHFESGRELLDTRAACPMPCVIRTAYSWSMIDGRLRQGETRIVSDERELQKVCAEDPVLSRTAIIVQPFIEGSGAGVFLCYDRGTRIASFAHRRLREKPPSGGVSVLSESAPTDPSLLAAATRLLDELDWHSVAMVEFRVATDGTPFLMEVNPRLWGTTQLAVDAGIDFPWLMVAATLGLAYERPQDYRMRVRLRWLLGDVDHALIRLRDADSIGERMAVVRRLLTPVAGSRNETLRLDDPRPAAREFASWLRALLRRS